MSFFDSSSEGLSDDGLFSNEDNFFVDGRELKILGTIPIDRVHPMIFFEKLSLLVTGSRNRRVSFVCLKTEELLFEEGEIDWVNDLIKWKPSETFLSCNDCGEIREYKFNKDLRKDSFVVTYRQIFRDDSRNMEIIRMERIDSDRIIFLEEDRNTINILSYSLKLIQKSVRLTEEGNQRELTTRSQIIPSKHFESSFYINQMIIDESLLSRINSESDSDSEEKEQHCVVLMNSDLKTVKTKIFDDFVGSISLFSNAMNEETLVVAQNGSMLLLNPIKSFELLKKIDLPTQEGKITENLHFKYQKRDYVLIAHAKFLGSGNIALVDLKDHKIVFSEVVGIRGLDGMILMNPRVDFVDNILKFVISVDKKLRILELKNVLVGDDSGMVIMDLNERVEYMKMYIVEEEICHFEIVVGSSLNFVVPKLLLL